MTRRLILVLGALTAPVFARAQVRDADVSAITDSAFARWNSKDSPGCAVGISRNGKVLLTRAYGMANLETGTPNTPETIMESGSVAKQFTATAVVLLAMDGKLSLDDDVRKYLPDFPRHDRVITIRHLLTHTSGLRDWSNVVALTGWPRGERAYTQADLLDFVYRQKSLNYPVGDYYSYTNSGFAVLETLIERVSGMSFADFTQTRIFQPLGMVHTSWRTDFTKVVPGRAQAYARGRDSTWHLDMPFEDVVGPGGMLTTVGDWLIWNDALTNNTLRAGHADSLTRRMRLTNGREITYALGIINGTYRSVPEIQHSGSTGGYATHLARYPKTGLSIAVLCNAAQATPGAYLRQIAEKLDALPSASLPAGPVDSAKAARWFGVYRNSRTHGALRVSMDTLRRARTMIEGVFLVGAGTLWRFGVDAFGKRELYVSTYDPFSNERPDEVMYTDTGNDYWKPTSAELRAFEGQYRSDEVPATYTLAVKGDSLTLLMRPGVTWTLRPTYKDGFTRAGTAVWFSRDASGRVTTMHISEARLWDLVVPRVR